MNEVGDKKTAGRRLAAWLVHPFLVVFTAVLHLFMLEISCGLLVSTYTPVVLAAAATAVLEGVMPHRHDWHPGSGDIRTDLAYMIVVQLALPRLLAITVGLGALNALRALDASMDIWPSDRPLVAQAILLVLCISFIRYWVHRACHEQPLLWRLHAVHHSPNKLYWLNLGRSHPLEEVLRFSTESLPFILLGVQAEVLSLYFVLLSVNGFLFHSNIRLRHGLLNHLFATAELHRWHHARDPATGACNYGNLLIVWDTLFGTRYLPSRGSVRELGLNERYPRRFLGQLAEPFCGLLEPNTKLPRSRGRGAP